MDRDVAWLKPRQRIFQRDKRRLSIRLEEEFWTQLELCAKEDHIKLADLVFSITTGQAKDKNRSSVLRSYCVRWLRQRLEEVRLLKQGGNLSGILAACPLPCMVITPERKIVAGNQPFLNEILGALVPGGKLVEADAAVRLSLGTPMVEIMRALGDSDGGYVEAHVGFSNSADTIQMIGRFCLLSSSAGQASPLLCFLRGLLEIRPWGIPGRSGL